MITPVQILALLFVSFAASRAVLRAKEKQITLGELIFWLTIWVGLIFVVFFPGITTYIASFLGVGRGVDAIIYVSIAMLFYLIFRVYIKIEEIESEITQIVREISFINKKRKR